MKLLHIILLSFYLLPTEFVFSQCHKQDYIFWSDSLKLQWYDFEGEPEDLSQHNIEVKARSAVMIIVEYGDFDCESIKAYTVFCRDKSWTVDTVSKRLLDHEQKHFDIVEIFTRKLNSEIKSLCESYEGEVADYYELYKRINKEMVEYQDEYDIETLHGTSCDKQREWDQKIFNQLIPKTGSRFSESDPWTFFFGNLTCKLFLGRVTDLL